MLFKKDNTFIHGHFQHIINRLPPIFHLESFPIVSLAFADFTGNVDIRQKMHLDFQDAIALTRFAASAFDVKREPPCGVPLCLGIVRLGEQLPNVCEYARIGCRIGTRRSADWRLVNVDDFVQILQPLHPFKCSGTDTGSIQLCCQMLINNLIHQRGLPRTGNSCHTGKRPQRN